MSKSNALETDWLALLFNGTTIANVANNATASPITNLYVSLHSSSPGETGDQTTNEATYVNYARVAVARTAGGWTISGNTVSPVATITFPQGDNLQTLTYFGVGSSVSGTGKLFYYGPITPSIPPTLTLTPRLTAATTITED